MYLSLSPHYLFTYNFYSATCQIFISQLRVPTIEHFPRFIEISNWTSVNLNTLSPSKTPAPCPVFPVLWCGSTIAWDYSSWKPGNCVLMPLSPSPQHLGSSSPISLSPYLPSPLYSYFPYSGPCHSCWPLGAFFLIFYLHISFSPLLPKGAFKNINQILGFNCL